jgi:ubiquinone/menaquinone biosynthesis C-methylase UbiE
VKNNTTTEQYSNSLLFERIIENLVKSGLTKEQITRKHTSVFDEFHIRGREVTVELLTSLQLNQSHKVLDVGCGLGGPCRMIAETYDCKVVGLDLTAEYIRTAQMLSELLHLDSHTQFLQGDALMLPFESKSFDLVFTQHVQMNIEDKAQFYSEINRVLKPGGKFIYYDVFCNGNHPLPYPLPWANKKSLSFLINSTEKDEYLIGLGMNEITTTNQSEKGSKFMNAFLEKAEKKPTLLSGQKLLMGDNTEEKLLNIQKCLTENRIVLQSGIWEK